MLLQYAVQRYVFLPKMTKNEIFLPKHLYMLEKFHTFASDYQWIVVRAREPYIFFTDEPIIVN